MPRTEIEFKLRLAGLEAKNLFQKKLVEIFNLKLKERRHLETDFAYNITGDLKLRARYWQEFFANSKGLNIKKIITLKMPRKSDLTVNENNEYEFELNGDFKSSENYKSIKSILENIDGLDFIRSFDNWLIDLQKVNDIYNFERYFLSLFRYKKVIIQDKIRLLYEAVLDGEKIEICFDELPSKEVKDQNVYFVEFSCKDFTTESKLKEIISSCFNLEDRHFDSRGYGKIRSQDDIGFKFEALRFD
jgi:hypothetical protein